MNSKDRHCLIVRLFYQRPENKDFKKLFPIPGEQPSKFFLKL